MGTVCVGSKLPICVGTVIIVVVGIKIAQQTAYDSDHHAALVNQAVLTQGMSKIVFQLWPNANCYLGRDFFY